MVQNRISFLVLTLLIAQPIAPVFAMNWEGHDDWVNEKPLYPELPEGVAAPILKPLPSCEAARARHAANPYEQTAIVGSNCNEAEDP